MTPRRARAHAHLQIIARYQDDGSEQVDHRPQDQHGVHERSSDVTFFGGPRTAAYRVIHTSLNGI
jgi:hypothetical protein